MKGILTLGSLAKMQTGGVLLAVLLMAGGCDRSVEDPLAALRANPTVEDAGPYIVFGAMVAAAEYLETDVDDIAAVLRSPSRRISPTAGSLDLSEGQFLIYPEGTEPTLFEELVFENTSQERVVLFVESMDQTRESQGFSYVKLEPGSKFVYQHNVHPAVVKVGVFLKGVATATVTKVIVVVGVVIIVGEELRSAFNSNFACNLSTKAIQPDECVGSCPGGICQGVPGSTQPYGFGWMGLAEPTACGC